MEAPPVCKPCWELKYCPYGELVESMPVPWTKEELAEIRNSKPDYAHRDLETEHLRARRLLRHVNPEDDQNVWSTINAVMYTEPDKYRELEQYDRRDIQCSMREGHSCPVFWHYSSSTETVEQRRSGRYITRDIMFKVARRDDYKCQFCFKPVRDDEIEFDHIIPVAKGGPTSVANIRRCAATATAPKAIRPKIWSTECTGMWTVARKSRRRLIGGIGQCPAGSVGTT